MRTIGRWLAREVSSIEDSVAPAWYFLATFFSVTTLRTLLELFSDAQKGAPPFAHFFELLSGIAKSDLAGTFAHYTLFYAALALTLILALRAVTGQDPRRLARLITTGFLVLLIVPLIDLIASGGAGYDLSYLSPARHGALLPLLFTFFGPFAEAGVSIGMRVEIALAILAAFAYCLYKGGGVVRSLAAAATTYLVIFFYIASPYVVQPLFALVGAEPQYSNLAGTRFFGLLALVQLLALLFLVDRARVMAFARDLRYPRLAHYYAMFLFGVLCAHAAGGFYLSTENATIFPLMFFALVGAWGFSVATNNLVDIDIDRISNPDRPLVRGALAVSAYREGAAFLFALALVAGALCGFPAFILVCAFIGAYFVYSMPPLRLKRIPYFSKLAIVLNSLFLFFAGFASFNLLPPLSVGEYVAGLFAALSPILLFTLPFVALLAANFIDLKDYEGDKAGGILTLPVLLGEKRAKLLIGGAFLFLYVNLGSLLVAGLLFYGAVALGLLQFYLINKREYQEFPVFMTYLGTLAVLFAALL